MKNAAQGHLGANAEGRRQNEERPGEATSGRMQKEECRMKGPHSRKSGKQKVESRSKPHTCDIKATSKRVDSQAVATPKPPPCDLKATLMRPQSHPHATLKPPPCDPKATLMRPQGSHKAPTKPGDGPRTTDHGPPESECRRKKEECRIPSLWCCFRPFCILPSSFCIPAAFPPASRAFP